jgi:hypothetical protein
MNARSYYFPQSNPLVTTTTCYSTVVEDNIVVVCYTPFNIKSWADALTNLLIEQGGFPKGRCGRKRQTYERQPSSEKTEGGFIMSKPVNVPPSPKALPTRLPWHSEPKERPSDEKIDLALRKLKAFWLQVAGTELAKNTEPMRFSGKKQRRLVVKANPDYQPPWGRWDSLSWGNRRSFTQLRQTVNYLIAPLVVDHIDFDVSIPTPRFTAITPDMSEEQMFNNLNAAFKKIGFKIEENKPHTNKKD